MKTITSSSRGKLGLLLGVAGLLLLVAPQAGADDKDPPTRVARISIVEGSVSLQPGGQGDWGDAARNRPVTIGDKLWVDKDSRAELQAGDVTFHLGSMTAFSFLNLDTGITQVRIPEGAVNFRIRELREGDIYEVDTPNVVFYVKEAGAFRVNVNETGESSRITVIRGAGEISADGKTYEVHAGEQADFNGLENPTYSIVQSSGPDGLDQWAQERDLKEDRSSSGNYVSRDMPGYDDLDDNGTWRDEPEYGHVWYPANVPPDWAPYSSGYWNWVAPWGWTWIDYAPWGFAPFHYGRWAFVGGGWGWCPGPFVGPPIYGPAFVGFLGGGWGFGLGFGVGWFPLGWGEPFYPWFHCSRGFVNVINVHNTSIHNVNILNTNGRNFNFVNAHNLRAVTTASHSTFVNGGRINRAGQRLTQASLNGARVTNSVGIRPTQHSTLGAANFNSHVARPPASVESRAVMARTAPSGRAASSPVRTMSGGKLSAGRLGNPHANSSASAGLESRAGNAQANARSMARQREIMQNRPPSARPGSNSRTWEAQGNTTDRGRAPQGFGSNRPNNAPAQNSARTLSNRPPWAGNGGPRGGNTPSRSSSPSDNRPNYSNSGRSYEPPQRSNGRPSYGNGGYAQQPSYSPRTYSSPGRSYPAPSRSYSPPSRSYSYGGGGSDGGHGGYGGGGGAHSYGGGGGGGGYHGGGGGGGSSHGGGGGGSSHGGGGGGGGKPHR